MKNFILISTLVISTTALANTKASKSERALLCDSVDQQLIQTSADMALDLKKCSVNVTIKSSQSSDGVIKVSGELDYNAPYRPSFKVDCDLSYIGTPEIKNIIGGIEAGVNCH